VDQEPLGSWPTWLTDGAIGGAVLPNAAFFGAIAWSIATSAGGTSERLGVAVSLMALVGGGFGGLAAPLMWWVATRSWRWSPLAGLALGPLAGGIGALLLFHAVEWLFSGRMPYLEWWHAVLLASAGGTALGPPWVAYLAVRSRRKRGLGVVAAAVVWAWSAGFCFVASVELLT
jgi:hypothetical protein